MWKRLILSVVLATTILSSLSFPVKRAYAAEYVFRPDCQVSIEEFSTRISEFLTTNLLGYAPLLILDFGTSLAERIPWVGGAVEPIDSTVDQIKSYWFSTLYFGVIATVFNYTAATLLEASLTLNSMVGVGSFVSYGYGVILGLTKLGLVIALIFIGFATMLRVSSYAMSKLLPKLIAAALGINFTFFFVSILAGWGTNLTGWMLAQTSPCVGNFGNTFNIVYLQTDINKYLKASAVTDQIDSSVTPTETEIADMQNDLAKNSSGDFAIDSGAKASGLLDKWKAGLVKIAFDVIWANVSLIFASGFSVIAALTFITLAVFLVIRYVILNLLIIFSPLIWLGFVIPGINIPKFGNIWSGWWNNFLQWSFFGPLIVFFISVISKYLSYIHQSAGSGEPGGAALAIAQLIGALIFSLGGIFLAKNMSGVGANLVSKGLGQAVRGGQGLVYGLRQRQIMAGQKVAKWAYNRAEKTGGKGSSLLGFLASATSQKEGAAATGAGLLSTVTGYQIPLPKTTFEDIRRTQLRSAMLRTVGATTARLPFARARRAALANASKEDIQKLYQESPQLRYLTQGAIGTYLSSRETPFDQRLHIAGLDKDLTLKVAIKTLTSPASSPKRKTATALSITSQDVLSIAELTTDDQQRMIEIEIKGAKGSAGNTTAENDSLTKVDNRIERAITKHDWAI
jgi:hypothetical protein